MSPGPRVRHEIYSGAGESFFEHLPPVVESLSIQGLRVGTTTVDLRLTRFGDGVAVDVARRLGRVEVEAIR